MTIHLSTANVRHSYRVAIRSTYHGPTDTRGSRISVTHCKGGPRKYYAWQDALDTADNHLCAIDSYLTELGWDGEWVIGANDNGGYVATCANV